MSVLFYEQIWITDKTIIATIVKDRFSCKNIVSWSMYKLGEGHSLFSHLSYSARQILTTLTTKVHMHICCWSLLLSVVDQCLEAARNFCIIGSNIDFCLFLKDFPITIHYTFIRILTYGQVATNILNELNHNSNCNTLNTNHSCKSCIAQNAHV